MTPAAAELIAEKANAWAGPTGWLIFREDGTEYEWATDHEARMFARYGDGGCVMVRTPRPGVPILPEHLLGAL